MLRSAVRDRQLLRAQHSRVRGWAFNVHLQVLTGEVYSTCTVTSSRHAFASGRAIVRLAYIQAVAYRNTLRRNVSPKDPGNPNNNDAHCGLPAKIVLDFVHTDNDSLDPYFDQLLTGCSDRHARQFEATIGGDQSHSTLSQAGCARAVSPIVRNQSAFSNIPRRQLTKECRTTPRSARDPKSSNGRTQRNRSSRQMYLIRVDISRRRWPGIWSHENGPWRYWMLKCGPAKRFIRSLITNAGLSIYTTKAALTVRDKVRCGTSGRTHLLYSLYVHWSFGNRSLTT